MSHPTRRAVLPGLILAAGLVLPRIAAAEGPAAPADASPSAPDEDDANPSPVMQPKSAAPAPAVAPDTKPLAEPPSAPADDIDAPADHWEFFTHGRISSFFSWSKGEGLPAGDTYANVDSDTPLHAVDTSAGGTGTTASSAIVLPRTDGTPSKISIASINSMRFRSGFTGNVLGVGVKRRLGDTKVTGYISATSVVDSQGQQKYRATPPDIREGYIKAEGHWGSVLMGRAAVLFDRGAVETDFLYLHGYGVGAPGDLNSTSQGPTGGQIGYGVLANGFSAGVVYATPKVVGVQLSVGLYDPASFTGNYERTKYPRAEFEMTVDEPLGSIGRVHAFFNGGYQTVYQKNTTDDQVGKVMGIGYGARVELGPVRLGAGGHRGRGLGLAYPGNASSETVDNVGVLRDTDGVFVMGQLVLGKFDLDGGYGKSTIHMTAHDLTGNPANPTGDPTTSVINTQTGTSAAVVFHPADWLHFDIDVMHADAEWDLGEHQRINYYNAGSTITW
jgi:hypothetical protein